MVKDKKNVHRHTPPRLKLVVDNFSHDGMQDDLGLISIS